MANRSRVWPGAEDGADRGLGDDRLQDGLPPRWAPGTDPASLPPSEMPKSIVVSRKALPPPNGSTGKNGSH